MIYIRR